MDLKPRNVAVLGSTGSIGVSALAVIEALPAKLRVVALSAISKTELALRQAIRHQPRWLVITDQQAASRQDWSALPEVTELLLGHEALEELVGPGGLHPEQLRQTVGTTGVSSRQPAGWGMPPALPANVPTNGRAGLTADEPAIDIVLGAIVGSRGSAKHLGCGRVGTARRAGQQRDFGNGGAAGNAIGPANWRRHYPGRQ